ncbi:CU044_2847 family protein [Streptomyces sp. NPDC058745]|uniref:CU044_2847 family protein n=2 Tax=unclassified Streptomyces TaxID=2593676 RepID=UPI003677E460
MTAPRARAAPRGDTDALFATRSSGRTAMPDVTKVDLGEAVLFVETERLGPDLAEEGLEGPRALTPDLSEVTHALSSFAGQIGEALHRAAPDRATVEFGCQLGLESGKLTALIVKGSATANLRVTLEWDRSAL